VANFNDNKSLQDALAKAESVYKQAITGKKSFEELAKEYSDDISKQNGGDLGYVKRGQ